MSGPLAGRIALVTGARTGIGAASAVALAAAGARVLACGRNDGDCASLVATITANGGIAVDHGLDVGDLPGIAPRIDAAVRHFGGLHIIVNNAATIEPMAPISGLDPVAFDNAMRVNVSSVAAITSAAWPHLVGGGRIINLLSGAAVKPLYGWAAYCAGKAGLLMLTRAIDAEGEAEGIRCFGLAPGLVDTGMQASIRAAGINAISNIAQASLSSPSDAAQAIVFLAGGDCLGMAGTMVDVRDPGFIEAMAKNGSRPVQTS